MGASPLFPLFIALFFLGIAALGRNHYEANLNQMRLEAESALQAGTFLYYRQIVSAYVLTHAGWTGSLSSADLAAQGIPLAVQESIGHVVVASAAGRQLIVYADMNGKGYEVYRQAEGDASIGQVVNGQFQSFNQGTPVPLPVTVPDGDVISFIEVGS